MSGKESDAKKETDMVPRGDISCNEPGKQENGNIQGRRGLSLFFGCHKDDSGNI